MPMNLGDTGGCFTGVPGRTIGVLSALITLLFPDAGASTFFTQAAEISIFAIVFREVIITALGTGLFQVL